MVSIQERVMMACTVCMPKCVSGGFLCYLSVENTFKSLCTEGSALRGFWDLMRNLHM